MVSGQWSCKYNWKKRLAKFLELQSHIGHQVSGLPSRMADELDWLEMLVASERVEEWLCTVCGSENSLASR